MAWADVEMNELMKPCFDALANELADICGGRPVVFFLNDGNWGDALIRAGAEAFFQRYDFRYEMVKVFDVKKKKISFEKIKDKLGNHDPVAVFNGGAGYDPRYGRLALFQQIAHEFSSNVLLPASYPTDISGAFPANSVFYARDKGESLSNVRNARFCHDMAFFLTPTAPHPKQRVGFFMREDGERPDGAPVPQRNRDISKEGRAHTPIKSFLDQISRFETICTNRLHVCIGAALLGRRVHFFPNDYFKNKLVFEASLEPYFPNVSFEQDYGILDHLSADPHSLWFRLKNFTTPR
jgi:exopolysaccharide biosynthesis predicted pyruvyltransferase EpsI